MAGGTNNAFNSKFKNKSYDHNSINDEYDDINIYVEEFNNEDTIGKIMNEITDYRKRRLSNENDLHKNKVLKESCYSPNRVVSRVRSGISQRSVSRHNSPTKISKIEPVIFFKVHENQGRGKKEQLYD
jgi:hypothetical protein